MSTASRRGNNNNNREEKISGCKYYETDILQHSSSSTRGKRKCTKKRNKKQVKQACVNCKKSHTRCENKRPCRRCINSGIASKCVDVPRKRRKLTDSPSPGLEEEKKADSSDTNSSEDNIEEMPWGSLIDNQMNDMMEVTKTEEMEKDITVDVMTKDVPIEEELKFEEPSPISMDVFLPNSSDEIKDQVIEMNDDNYHINCNEKLTMTLSFLFHGESLSKTKDFYLSTVNQTKELIGINLSKGSELVKEYVQHQRQNYLQTFI